MPFRGFQPSISSDEGSQGRDPALLVSENPHTWTLGRAGRWQCKHCSLTVRNIRQHQGKTCPGAEVENDQDQSDSNADLLSRFAALMLPPLLIPEDASRPIHPDDASRSTEPGASTQGTEEAQQFGKVHWGSNDGRSAKTARRRTSEAHSEQYSPRDDRWDPDRSFLLSPSDDGKEDDWEMSATRRRSSTVASPAFGRPRRPGPPSGYEARTPRPGSNASSSQVEGSLGSSQLDWRKTCDRNPSLDYYTTSEWTAPPDSSSK